jgi:chromate transport protein ChrA
MAITRVDCWRETLMEYLKWFAFGIQAISIALIFAAFVRIGRRPASDDGKFYFRPWLLAYGLVIFVLWSLIDVVLKMKFLE